MNKSNLEAGLKKMGDQLVTEVQADLGKQKLIMLVLRLKIAGWSKIIGSEINPKNQKKDLFIGTLWAAIAPPPKEGLSKILSKNGLYVHPGIFKIHDKGTPSEIFISSHCTRTAFEDLPKEVQVLSALSGHNIEQINYQYADVFEKASHTT